jgi:tetratricopeptide (TPR) repeat protein
LDLALPDIDMMAKLMPTNGGPWDEACMAHVIVGDDFNKALAAGKEASRIDGSSNVYPHLFCQALAYVKLGQLADALSIYKQLYVRYHGPRETFGKAVVESKLGLSEDAAADFSEARQRDKKIDEQWAKYGIK